MGIQENFIHLRVHSEFSLSCGMVTVDKLIQKCIQYKQPAVAITDKHNLCTLIKFYTKAKKAGLKPICGAEVYIIDANENISSIILLCMNNIGYRNLTRLISRAYVENQQNDVPLIKKYWLEQQSSGLIVLSGGLQGDIARALIKNDSLQAEQLLKWWLQHFPNRFYLELNRLNKPEEDKYIQSAVDLAIAHNCPIVATNDVMFLEATEFMPHEAKSCIYESTILEDPKRNRLFSKEQYFKTTSQMKQLFDDLPSAIENTIEIARRCTIDIELGKNVLPEYPIPQNHTIDSFFSSTAHNGLKTRLKHISHSNNNTKYTEADYQNRLDFELNIIIQMGFQGYFLIVMDFIQWAKNHDIPVGPGRGSGAGSLVAYVLGITDLDPLEYELLFERFLNPERVSMPDFDIDFCMDKRDAVIDYVAKKYGREAVSQIITFGTMAAKAVVRDVARVQGKSYGLADRLSKMIPFEIGISLQSAYEQEDTIREFIANDSDAQEIWQMSLSLEGQTRNFGKHAGGVVIAPNKITDFAPLYCDDKGHGLVTQFDKNDVEAVGLVKFDFLGLRTLTIIDWAIKSINAKKRANNEDLIDISKININDSKAFVELKKGETTGIFQLESRGMKELIKRLLPDSLEDIIALVALFRPGPLQSGMVDNFINRKHKREAVSYPDAQYQHESLKPILEPTYGIILYQEQVMQIAQVLAGYTLGGADMLRRAMGKKKPEEMAKQRQVFQDGAIKKGIDGNLAMKIFDLVEKFAGYGFNKSHSAAYGLISYQTLWLKTNYPSEFMAAVVSSDMQNTTKVVDVITAIHKMNIKLSLPDINHSYYRFKAVSNDEIVYGLGAIKGLGKGVIDAIIDIRETDGRFKDLYDFCLRTSSLINKKSIEALIFSGALDSLLTDSGSHNLQMTRAALNTYLPIALKVAIQEEERTKSGTQDLFGNTFSAENLKNIVLDKNTTIKPFDKLEILKNEKDYLGMYVSGHPIDTYQQEFANFIRNPLYHISAKPKVTQKVAGLIINKRINRNKRDEKIITITLSDATGTIDAVIFPQVINECQHAIKDHDVVIVEGEVTFDEYSGSLRIRVQSLKSIAEARISFAKNIQLDINHQQIDNKLINQLTSILNDHNGSMSVNIKLTKNNVSGMFQLASRFNVNPTDECLKLLKQTLTNNTAVDVIY